MYLEINDITGAHHNVDEGSVRVTCMRRGNDRYFRFHEFHFHVTITSTTVQVDLAPGDLSRGVGIDLATVQVSTYLIDATRRLFNMVGQV